MSALVLSLNEQDLSKLVTAINQLAQGRSNGVVAVTLTANAASTVVNAVACGAGSYPLPIALSANAAAELGNGTMYVSAVAKGSFTITHANNAQVDRNFGFFCVG